MEKKKSYCGIKAVPKGKNRGSMKQCAESNQVRLYGLHKIDPKLLIKDKTPKKPLMTMSKAFAKSSAISGKISRLERSLTAKISEQDKMKIKEEMTKLKTERSKYLKAFTKIQKGDKVYVSDVKNL